MGKSFRNVKLALVLGREGHPHPASKGGGAGTDIYSHIKNFPTDHIEHLSLGLLQLVVQPAQDAPGRMGVIILHKFSGKPVLAILPGVIGFQKKSPRVLKHFRFDDHDFAQFGGNDFDRHDFRLLGLEYG